MTYMLARMNRVVFKQINAVVYNVMPRWLKEINLDGVQSTEK